jgi:non-specific protein-tyrosine kinase
VAAGGCVLAIALALGGVRPALSGSAVRAVAAGVVGVPAAVLVAVAVDRRSPRRVTEGEVSAALGAPVLATLAHRRGPGSAAPALLDASGSDAAERVRIARATLVAVLAAREARVVVVTSAREGEGKTTAVADLAVALARDGRHVAVVDADLRDPGLEDRFHLDPGPGLVDVLRGGVALTDLAPPLRSDVGVGSLRIVVAGADTDEPSELLGSVGPLLRSLREAADVVLVDTPPVLPFGDAVVVGRHADAAVVVVDPRRTTVAELRSVADRLAVPVVGAIVDEL